MAGGRTQHSMDERRPADVTRTRGLNLWRPNSLINLVSISRRPPVLNSYHSVESFNNGERSPVLSNENNCPHRSPQPVRESSKKGWSTIVTVIVVEAKGLPDRPTDGSGHSLYCKIRLGAETLKSKAVQTTSNPEWRERLTLHLNKDPLLRISVWDKGKQKNFMGSCVIDLASLEKERSHEIWQQLDDGFGSLHLNVTMCAIRNAPDTPEPELNFEEIRQKYYDKFDFYDWKTVGELNVKMIAARGLSGKPSAYCTLELGNCRVQTPTVKGSSEHVWKKSYTFNVHDVTSPLDVKVYDSSVISSVSSLRMDYLGKVSIPLLRIQNSEMRWYALKDRSKRHSAKGNCPRVLLEMALVWNPVKAALKLFRPTEEKYMKKSPKFDIPLIYNNLLAIRTVFNGIYEVNEAIKRFMEWENTELNTAVLVAWLVFWYYITLWASPLLLLVPLTYKWFHRRHASHERLFLRTKSIEVESPNGDSDKADISLMGKIQELPEVTLSITDNLEYIMTTIERIYNLFTFKVPFLSYLTMILLIIVSIGLYIFPFNYLMMGLGIYKYTRKYLDPERKLNNDILDFISRVPNNEVLKDWEELGVPEPNHHRNSAGLLFRTNCKNT